MLINITLFVGFILLVITYINQMLPDKINLKDDSKKKTVALLILYTVIFFSLAFVAYLLVTNIWLPLQVGDNSVSLTLENLYYFTLFVILAVESMILFMMLPVKAYTIYCLLIAIYIQYSDKYTQYYQDLNDIKVYYCYRNHQLLINDDIKISENDLYKLKHWLQPGTLKEYDILELLRCDFNKFNDENSYIVYAYPTFNSSKDSELMNYYIDFSNKEIKYYKVHSKRYKQDDIIELTLNEFQDVLHKLNSKSKFKMIEL